MPTVWRLNLKTAASEGVDARMFCINNNILNSFIPSRTVQAVDDESVSLFSQVLYNQLSRQEHYSLPDVPVDLFSLISSERTPKCLPKKTLIDRREALKLLALLASSAIFPQRALANLMLKPTENEKQVPAQLVAVGGGASNFLNGIIEDGQWNGKSIAIDADKGWLELSKATVRIQIGRYLSHETGCGADLWVGKRAAQESGTRIRSELAGAHTNVIIACLGGGTGGGAGPLVAHWSQRLGVPTIAVLTMPFSWEGGARFRRAAEALNEFRLNSIRSKVHCMSWLGKGLVKDAILENDKEVARYCLAFLEQVRIRKLQRRP